MPLPPVAGIVRYAVLSTLGDDNDVLNIHHQIAGHSSPLSGADLLSAASEFFTLWTTAFSGLMSDQVSTLAVTAKDLSVVDGGEATHVATSPVVGGRGSASLPANCALVISWKESLSYRGGHPRTYLTGIPVDVQNDPQHVNSTFQGQVTTAANNFISAVAGGSWPASFDTVPPLCVVHYSLSHFTGTLPLVEAILSALANTRIDSQRRRLGS